MHDSNTLLPTRISMPLWSNQNTKTPGSLRLSCTIFFATLYYLFFNNIYKFNMSSSRNEYGNLKLGHFVVKKIKNKNCRTQ